VTTESVSIKTTSKLTLDNYLKLDSLTRTQKQQQKTKTTTFLYTNNKNKVHTLAYE